MFDIGFLEIMVIMIIALLVIGPERMPEVARKLGSFMGKTRNFINQMKQDSPLQETVREVQDAMNLEEEKRSINNISKELEQGLNFNDTGIDLEDFQRPFGGDAAETNSSQFNKAPAQPQLPQEQQAKTAEQETSNPDVSATETASSTEAPTEKASEAPEAATKTASETQKS